MAGKDRILDPETGDYVSDGKGGLQTTTDLRTAVWHQVAGKRTKWVGDPDAGSDLYTFERVGNSEDTAIAAKDAMARCLQPFIESGRGADLVVDTDRAPLGRLTVVASMKDVSHGQIDVAPFTPGGP